MCGHTSYSKGIKQPVANPARGQLNGEIKISLFPLTPENLVTRDGFSRPSVCSFSILWLNLVLTYRIPPEFRGGVHLFM